MIGVISASVVCGTVQKSTCGDGPRNSYGHGGGWVGGRGGVRGKRRGGCVWGGGGELGDVAQLVERAGFNSQPCCRVHFQCSYNPRTNVN